MVLSWCFALSKKKVLSFVVDINALGMSSLKVYVPCQHGDTLDLFLLFVTQASDRKEFCYENSVVVSPLVGVLSLFSHESLHASLPYEFLLFASSVFCLFLPFLAVALLFYFCWLRLPFSLP
jgi:hypothetical protein